MIIGIVQIIIAIIAIMVAIIISLFGFVYLRNRKLNASYEILWTKSSSLRPEEVLGIRGKDIYGFNNYYFEREVDQIIRNKLEKGDNILVIGNPLAGKTRAIYQALMNGKPSYDVIIPRLVDVNLEDFHIPLRLTFWRKRVLILDDIDKYLEKQNVKYLIQEFIQLNAIIIATCRSGQELKKLLGKMEKELLIFVEPTEIPKVQKEKAKKIAKEVGKILPASFDGNIGSILLPLDTMKSRFQNCDDAEKATLRALKHLYYAGIYRERELFSVERIKLVCRKQEGLEKQPFQWTALFNALKNKGFIDVISEKEVGAEEVYLENVVEHDFEHLANLKVMMEIFNGDPEALNNIAVRAFEVGNLSLEKSKYLILAITAYEKVLKFCSIEHYPKDYAMTRLRMGAAYCRLGEVEDTPENCRKSIAAYEDSLRVLTIDRFPTEYAMIQSNIGVTYSQMSTVEDKVANCKRAISAYMEALKIRTIEGFPLDYATTQNNIGIAYGKLAEAEEREQNCKKAIGALNESLKVRTIERNPIEYATTQMNLGNVYGILGQVEDSAENWKKAIIAMGEALRVYSFERFPIKYAGIQNNLGNIYFMLSQGSEKEENWKRTINAYEEALKVHTFNNFPMDYAITQKNIGELYLSMAKNQDKSENLKKAISTFKAVLRVYSFEHFPVAYASTQMVSGAVHATLAELEDRVENCKKAFNAFNEAAKVFTQKEFPEKYRLIIDSLAQLRHFCEGGAHAQAH